MQKEDRMKKYADFQAKDFAMDAYFLQWRLLPDEECTRFWTEFCEQHPEKASAVQRAIQIVGSVRMNHQQFSETEKARKTMELLSFIRWQKRKQRRKRLYAVWGVAASVLVAVLFWTLPEFLSFNSFVASTHYVVPEEQDIRLISDDNQVISMSDSSRIICNPQGEIEVNGKRQELTAQPEADTFRQLVVPRGKRASVQLADGTVVWINSDTKVEFPVAFNGTKRQIKVDGEIYLEVAKNKEKPFVVSTPQFDVEVLGTKFGISSSLNKSQYVVLVEGAVQVHTLSGKTTRLKPSQLFGIDKGGYFVRPVDPYKYISWKDNVLYFKGEKLPDVLMRLAQQYAVDIDCNIDVCQVQFYGKLVMEEHIEDVLDNIAVLLPIKYEVRNNKIIVNLK